MNKYIFAEGGLQFSYPSNTLCAYTEAINKGFGVVIDIRVLNDNNFICYRNRYMNKLLDYPGKISKVSYDFLNTLYYKDTKYTVETLENVLKKLDKFSKIIIRLNGKFSKSQINKLVRICINSKHELYFLTYNLLTLSNLKLCKKNNFKIISFFYFKNQNLQILKGKKYSHLNFIPEFDDVVAEVGDKAENIIRNIYTIFNTNKTRIKKDHFLLTNIICHRCICSKLFKEHSKEAILGCIEKGYTPEIDIILHKGEIKCYHSDKISKKLGQEASISEKENIENAILFKDVLTLIDGKVPILIDIKNPSLIKFNNRKLEEDLMVLLNNYKGEYAIQSWNPLCLKWFYNNFPEIIRIQVGTSLGSLNKMRPIAVDILNLLLFSKGRFDGVNYTDDKYVSALFKVFNIAGVPVFLYTRYHKKEKEKVQKLGYANVIIEILDDEEI